MATKNRRSKVEILKLFNVHYELSKTQLMQLLSRDDNGNVSVLCDGLRHSGLIEPSGVIHSRGKVQRLYRLTSNGIVHLVRNSKSPNEFWNILVHWTYNAKKSPNWEMMLCLLDE